ncbi:hypothetical protein C8R45DRAFT_933153 [Mycena sanguinolenta]|nr:hypothetical protein C8R45DRAFT_933153 [Mycena sanguinolenta]
MRCDICTFPFTLCLGFAFPLVSDLRRFASNHFISRPTNPTLSTSDCLDYSPLDLELILNNLLVAIPPPPRQKSRGDLDFCGAKIGRAFECPCDVCAKVRPAAFSAPLSLFSGCEREERERGVRMQGATKAHRTQLQCFGLRGLVFTGCLALAGGRIDYISDPFHSASRDGQADGWSGDGTPSNEITCRATVRATLCPRIRLWVLEVQTHSSGGDLSKRGSGLPVFRVQCRADRLASWIFWGRSPIYRTVEMAFAGWSGDGVHYIALSSAMANRSLWCIPSSLHFFFFHSVARIGLHRDGTGLRWSASGPSHKQRLTAVTLLIFTLNQVLCSSSELTAPIRLVCVTDLGCPLDARGDKKIFVPKMTHDFQHVFVGAEVCSEIVVGARSRWAPATKLYLRHVLASPLMLMFIRFGRNHSTLWRTLIPALCEHAQHVDTVFDSSSGF